MLVPRWNDNHSQSFVNPVSHQPRHLSTSALRQTRSSTSPYSLHPTIRDSQLSQIQNKLPALADPEEFPSLPGQSNAVPIRQPQPPVGDHVIPSWAQEQPVRSLLPVRYTPEIRAPSSTSHDGKSSGSSESQHNTPTESSGHELNVFARPFVSEALLVINELNGQIFDTAGVKEINFEIYVGRCLGWDFLPIIPRPITPPVLASSDLASLELTDALTDRSYEYYFRAHLEAEIESQKAENETYALYEHDIQNPTVNQHGCTTCSIRIPGLRENSPYIEEDDIIQLRELIYDRYNRLLGMDSWMNPPSRSYGYGLASAPEGRWRGELAPGWTGIIYNARVLAVQRKHNILVIRIDDSPHIRGWIRSSPRFNIQFPVPMKRYQPMKDVLPIIQEVLKQANRARYPIAGRSANQPFTSYSKPSTDAGNNFKVTNPPITPWIQSMLFPVESDCDTQTKLNPGRFKQAFFDNQLNWEQKKAIESICSRNYGTLPFLISGPPGTGKTKTLVEVALQLVKRSDGVSHVLFCAPSDPAADMIVQRLSSHFNTNELLRLNRSSRSFAEVPGGVLPFCCICEDRFDLPKFQQIMACKLVVTTCRDASLLLYSRLSNVDLVAAEYGLRCAINPDATPPAIVDLHWTAVLIDEAAQSMEPEALIPLSIVAPPLGSAKLASQPLVIMAGDENQFGPRTSLASSPLKTSLFARLFARQVYSEHPLSRGKSGERQPKTLQQTMLPIARPAFANLIRNYRSHPAILAVPSSRFYFDTLEPEAADTHCLVSWSGWRGRKWPVLFHKNESEDSMDLENGGWSNAGEAQLACEYAASLVKSGLVAQKDICIMSPFKAQVARLRSIARDPRFALWDVDIGPTEAFQGLERSVVILCTTRSKQLFVASDVASNQGIINLPKSMNVALTRAKFGLIVIGRRNVLKSDPNWRAFVEFCERNGLVAGDEDEDGVGGEGGTLTRLEKVLLDREARAREQEQEEEEEEEEEEEVEYEHERSANRKKGVMGVYPQEDEMTRYGMQFELEADRYDEDEHEEQEEEEEEEWQDDYGDQDHARDPDGCSDKDEDDKNDND